MIQKRIRQMFCNLKENSSVSFAHIATMGGFCNIDLLLIKATSPDNFPLNDKYVQQLFKILSIAPTSCRTFASCFTQRFMKTQCWRVALKSLLLLHRLLRSMPVNSHFRVEMLRARLNGAISFNPCSFQDISSSSAEDYSVFVRCYAYLIDEALECFAIDIPELEAENPSEKMKQVGRLIEVLPQLQSLIDSVMNCRPKGVAGKNILVQRTMKYIIRDSFVCYTSSRKDIVVILENLVQLPYKECIEAFGIYKKAAIQAIHLSEFYDWSKPIGYCGAYEYPFVDQIPAIQIRALGTFLQGMWQLTAEGEEVEPSNAASIRIRSPPPPSTAMEDDQKEMENLIQFEDDNNEVSWEVLLEASLPNHNTNTSATNNAVFLNNLYGYNATNFIGNNQWQIQVWATITNGNPFVQNHFYQTFIMPNFYNGSVPQNATYPLTF